MIDYVLKGKDLAKKYNGEFLSKECISSQSMCLWRCENGHEFTKLLSSVRRGFWCQFCTGRRVTIEDVRKFATSKGAELLSEEFKYKYSKIKWRCKNNHVFEMSYYTAQKHWCRECSGHRILTLEDMQAVAQKRGGECLSQSYKNHHNKLVWRCKYGHEWSAIAGNIIYRKKWCPYCAGNAKYTLESINEFLKDKGKCISPKYLGARKQHTFRCNQGHVWKTSVTKVMSGRWCIYCSESFPERFSRAIFQAVFDKKFPKYKAKWLKNENNHALELDGYCEKLGIAFEHHGGQHYSLDTLYSSERLLLNDQIKKDICANKGIKLFEVKQLQDITAPQELIDELYDYCNKESIKYNIINKNKILADIKPILNKKSRGKNDKRNQINNDGHI